MSLYFRCSQTGAVLFPGGIWKCVQSVLVAITGKGWDAGPLLVETRDDIPFTELRATPS